MGTFLFPCRRDCVPTCGRQQNGSTRPTRTRASARRGGAPRHRGRGPPRSGSHRSPTRPSREPLSGTPAASPKVFFRTSQEKRASLTNKQACAQGDRATLLIRGRLSEDGRSQNCCLEERGRV